MALVWIVAWRGAVYLVLALLVQGDGRCCETFKNHVDGAALDYVVWWSTDN